MRIYLFHSLMKIFLIVLAELKILDLSLVCIKSTCNKNECNHSGLVIRKVKNFKHKVGLTQFSLGL